MKRKLFFLLSMLVLVTISCSKDNIGDDIITDTPRTQVPDGLTGQWLNGDFKMSKWWNYRGQVPGDDYEPSKAFVLKKNGDAEYFEVKRSKDNVCITETLIFFSGTVAFDTADQKFTFYPRKGNLRGFYSCKPFDNFDRRAEEHELNSIEFYWTKKTDDDGQRWLITRFTNDPDAERKHFKATHW